MIRWQLSTPILALVLWLLAGMNALTVTIIANLIGSLIFFWVDKFIFRSFSKVPLWEIKKDCICIDCNKKDTGYRIVEWRGYNRRVVKNPQFRCKDCSNLKLEKIKSQITPL